jgi:hypothetical protein
MAIYLFKSSTVLWRRVYRTRLAQYQGAHALVPVHEVGDVQSSTISDSGSFEAKPNSDIYSCVSTGMFSFSLAALNALLDRGPATL